MTKNESGGPGNAAVLSALLAVYVLWGSTYYAIKIALQNYPPFLLTSIRMLIAGGLMFAVLRWRGEAAPTRNPRHPIAGQLTHARGCDEPTASRLPAHFPMQKRLKMRSSKSFVWTLPAIAPI